jgi:hypothetical protein
VTAKASGRVGGFIGGGDQLEQQARTRHVRFTTYVRAILEHAARGGSP